MRNIVMMNRKNDSSSKKVFFEEKADENEQSDEEYFLDYSNCARMSISSVQFNFFIYQFHTFFCFYFFIILF